MRLLLIQIPCLNEEASLPTTLKALPRKVEGFDAVRWLVIDDGSTDRTVKVAHEYGADYVLSLNHRQGLARAFSAGLEFSLRAGADVIVNTDADNQYSADCIPDLVRPILLKKAQIVIGSRPIEDIQTFSPLKKWLQSLGSWIVRTVSGTTIPDAPSGFRAIHKDAAIQLKIFNRYTYTLEMIIQAGLRNIPITAVPIRVNPEMRPSRLISNMFGYVLRSAITTTRVFITYAPLRFFSILAGAALLPAIFLWVRFIYEYMTGGGHGHIQSLILSSSFVAVAGILGLAGVIGDLMATNRQLLEDIRVMLIRRKLTDKHPAEVEPVILRER
jgi:glycosyltransferase involved in cell wall biosynthesis